MSQSLYTAMGGISSAQTSLSVISNNIANINTTAFKSSSVNFSDVFYTTISSGTAATGTTGGINPEQVGLGVQVSSVSKDFSSGTWVATGKTTDLMIQGTGFFSVRDSSGQVYYTRAGDFSIDSDGDMVTTDGYKVLGTDTVLSATSSSVPVHIPQALVSEVTPDVGFYDLDIKTLNNCQLTDGAFTLSINNLDPPLSITVDTASNTTMADLVADIQRQLNDATSPATATAATTAANTALTAANALPSGTIPEQKIKAAAIKAANNLIAEAASATAAAAAGIDFSNVQIKCDATTGGTIQFLVDGTTATSLKFGNPKVGASNFLAQTGFATARINDATHTYTSDVLDWKVDVTQVTSISEASKINSYSIGEDGSIESTYANGDTLSVRVGADGNTYKFVYTTAENVVITGSNVNVDPNVAVPANYVIQLASVTNNDGLIASGSNLYTAGPNCGDIVYSIGSAMGLGAIASGGLEASNVDLSSEFSTMILAQRAVQANSRVFTTTSDVMDVIVQMGR